MPDPKAQTLVAAIRTAVLAIPAGQYKPDQVVTVATFNSEVLDPSYASVVALWPDQSADQRLTFGPIANVKVEYPVDLAVCRKYDHAENPFTPPEVRRWAEQDEMVRIVKNALRADRTFGGVALDSEVITTDETADSTYIEGWAVAFMRLVASYRHDEVAA